MVLFERLGPDGLVRALAPFDAIYQQADTSPLAEVAERLASALPADVAEIDLAEYRALRPPWNRWSYVVERGRASAPLVARIALEGS